MATAIYSSLTKKPVDNLLAMTGEISIQGRVKPVGGVISKIEAGRRAGLRKILIPADNWLSIFDNFSDIEIVPVRGLEQVFQHAFLTDNV